MSSFSIRYRDAGVLAALRGLSAMIGDPSAITRAIAALGESATRLRFRTQMAPDGTPWKPSLRAQVSGGRTLTQDGHLSGSISARHGPGFAEWGVNRIYAAIHQFGGTIRAKSGKALRFRLAGGKFATVKAVKMPARPYLGISSDDRGDILDLIQRRLVGAAGAR
jgi:phage virion morphogenesis protein